jgi:hypothetical protein
MKSQPLADTELDHLSAVLERFGDKRSMNLEQLDGLASFLIHDIGAPHDLTHRECLLAKRAQNILSIVQHNETPRRHRRYE